MQIIVNSAHPFFTKVYANSETTTWVRETIDCLLLVMGEAEVKSQHDLARKTWYAQERLKWSQHLSLLLEVLPDFTSPPEDSDADDAADDEVAPPAKLPAMP